MLFVFSNSSWLSASNTCKARGGSLVVPNTIKNMEFKTREKESEMFYVGMRKVSGYCNNRQTNSTTFRECTNSERECILNQSLFFV